MSNKKDNKEKLEKYISLVEFIGSACGKSFEVILHDVSNPEESVIAIKNGHLSGRKIGDPMTDLAISIMNENEHTDKDFISNYEGRLKNGKQFVSATYFIKEKNELIGMLCINHDPSDILKMNECLTSLMDNFYLLSNEDKSPYFENLDSSIGNISNNIIRGTVDNLKIDPSRMTSDEKMHVIKELDSQEVFSTKGSVPQVAKELKISEPTVYRYLKIIRK